MQYQSDTEKKKKLKIGIRIALIITGSIAFVMLSLFIWVSILLSSPAEFAEPDYVEVLSGYATRLNIYMPAREPEYCYDDHGGMVGDGDTIIVLNLSEKEKDLLENDIAENKNWLAFPLSNDDANILYGEAYCNINEVNGPLWASGLLDSRIKRLNRGYYCIFDKQTEKHQPLKNDEPCSYNFIFVEYDIENNTLYIQEFDS